MHLVVRLTKKDRIAEGIVVAFCIILGMSLVASTVVQFFVTGRSPYMTLTIWYVAEIWYRTFGGKK